MGNEVGTLSLAPARAPPCHAATLRHRVRKFQKWIVENTDMPTKASWEQEHRERLAGTEETNFFPASAFNYKRLLFVLFSYQGQYLTNGL